VRAKVIETEKVAKSTKPVRKTAERTKDAVEDSRVYLKVL
jgi:hypothetical protein